MLHTCDIARQSLHWCIESELRFRCSGSAAKPARSAQVNQVKRLRSTRSNFPLDRFGLDVTWLVWDGASISRNSVHWCKESRLQC